ncbi:tryptophan synthase subunit alpha [Feifania hominis]|uniref:tryptophan synthase n=1 Tax=Feifania hominis TaxID=2763660 RepID=A0A926HVK5_9FIRM|nr:tryptophan synthase subunit alpha [Feifania hominis]MBC8536721.1 tryptophan synthase subunit alpha [Feifania hominis]
MSFHPVYYIVMGYPTLEKTEQMIDRYVAHGVSAVQLDMPSKDPYGESPFIQERMAAALAKYPSYDFFMDSIRAIRKKHPTLEIHLVVYPDVIETIGLDRFIDFCNETGLYSVLGAKDSKTLDYMNERGVVTSTFINYDLNDPQIALAKRNDKQIVLLRNAKEGITPRPGCESVRDRVAYVRAQGVTAPLFAVAGITSRAMLEEAKQAGADGAYIGTILMKQWDDEPKLWAMLDDFESVSEP